MPATPNLFNLWLRNNMLTGVKTCTLISMHSGLESHVSQRLSNEHGWIRSKEPRTPFEQDKEGHFFGDYFPNCSQAEGFILGNNIR